MCLCAFVSVCCHLCVYVCVCLSQVISQGYPLSLSFTAPSLQPTISSKHLQPTAHLQIPSPHVASFYSREDGACPSHQSIALFIFMYRRGAKKGPLTVCFID
ncbi:hypothetical protein FQA47_009795 [Oryzias melastigma]|uniref:Secreted protein n=1 Tax=Oryzias melastigma TaxID=30732 RepID=A0A834CBT6_ORYME|nr:hypothetical protein FQA47_009795 [Oryzias melastigma]